MMNAASLPSPLRMTLSGVFLTLFAVLAMPIAPSAAANDSCPARNAKHLVLSLRSIAARLPCPRPTLRCSATEPGMQKDWSPSPIASAASAAFTQFFLIAIAQPTVYAHTAFSKQMGWMPLTIALQSTPLERQISLASSRSLMPYCARTPLILSILLS